MRNFNELINELILCMIYLCSDYENVFLQDMTR
jgi:hypothetical protein